MPIFLLIICALKTTGSQYPEIILETKRKQEKKSNCIRPKCDLHPVWITKSRQLKSRLHLTIKDLSAKQCMFSIFL